MGKLSVSTAMTVDGVMSVEEWFVQSGGHDAAGKAMLADAEAAVLGRKNFEGLAGYWTKETGEWADLINPMPKYVASRTLAETLAWNGTLLEGDAVTAVARLKEEHDGDLITWGCGELTSMLLTAGLVDELVFWLHPALWGKGDRPFWEKERIRLESLGSETFDSGVTLLRYAPVPS
jgi:dihydrofolate reductase